MTAIALALDALRRRSWQSIELPEPVPLATLPTPALVVDADALERNFDRMAQALAARGKGVRPHAKTHKCPLIAQAQLARGAVGICTAKVAEAVVMVQAGIDQVLVTSPVVDANRAGVLVELAREACSRNGRAAIDIVVDSTDGLDALINRVGADDQVGILVDVDLAMGRTGTRDRDVALALADRAANTPGLAFRGMQHYAGHLMHRAGRAVRRAESLALWETLAQWVDDFSTRGFAPAVVTGAGTGTWDIDVDVPCLTDLQVGSYIFMDRQYQDIGNEAEGSFADFEVALELMATVISQPRAGAVTVDAGYKAFAADAGVPVIRGRDVVRDGSAPDQIVADPGAPGLTFRFAGDEHGILIGAADSLPALGDHVRFVVPHCDPTVNLHDFLWVRRGDMVREIWPIAARGCSW